MRTITNSSPLESKHALCYAVQTLIAAVIDIAQHIISDMSSEAPLSYAEALTRLGDLGVLPQKFAADFSRVAGLRNVVVHAYDKLDIERIVSLLPKLMADTTIFLQTVSRSG